MKGKVLLVLAIVEMFVIPMMPAKEPEINYLEDAKNLLQSWENKLSTEGATSVEVKEIIQKMELYKQRLEDEVKIMEITENMSPREIVDRLNLIMQLDAQIEWEKYFLERCEIARKEYRENDEKFNIEYLNTLSTSSVYPTGGWKKTKRTSGAGGIYEADYNVNQKKGYTFSRSDNYNSGYAQSALYWETWWSGVPVHWQVQYNGQYYGYSSGHITFDPIFNFPLGLNNGVVDITYYAWDTYNGIKVREKRFGGYLADSVGMQYHGNSFHPSTDFWIGNNPLEKWEIGIHFKADTLAWGLADMEVNHYLPPNICWKLNSIEITTL